MKRQIRAAWDLSGILKAKDPLHTPVTGGPRRGTRDIAIPETKPHSCNVFDDPMALRGNQRYDGHSPPQRLSRGRAMSCTSMMRPIVPVAFASMFAALSPTLAHSASLFICNVTAADGGCANGTSTTPGFVTFDFTGFLADDSFVGGLPATTSPAQAPASGEIDFSFSWHTLSPGVDTPEQTIFFVTSGGLVADVLDYASSVSGGAGRDFMVISGYVLPLATPVTVADLASEGITPTGSVSLPVLYEFPTTDLTATFQPAPIPELPTWGLMALGFASLGLSGSHIRRSPFEEKNSWFGVPVGFSDLGAEADFLFKSPRRRPRRGR